MPQTANERLLNLSLRHAVDLRRFSVAEIRKLTKILEDSEKDMLRQVEASLGSVSESTRQLSARARDRLDRLIGRIRDVRMQAMAELKNTLRDDLVSLAHIEADHELAAFDESVGFKLDMERPSAEALRAIVTSHPMSGKTVRDWGGRLASSDRTRFERAIRLGMVEGETIPQLMARTRGVVNGTRAETEALVRTSVNYVSNAAREEVWDANSDIVQELQWVATLDGRTSAVCRARDGKTFPTSSGPRPPAHFNCRSLMVAVIDGEAIATSRATVKDTRRRNEREKDFRADARANGTTVQQERAQWAREKVGQVPGQTNYQKWLGGQDARFQDEVLGATKGALFRRGGLTLDKFVDRQGNELSLDQLRAREPRAFERAGL